MIYDMTQVLLYELCVVKSAAKLMHETYPCKSEVQV